MMSDESPNEVAPQKSKFKLKINLKKDKPVKEAKPDTRPKPAKFFKSPSFKSPASNKRTTPKTSPESKNVRTEDEDSPARDSSAERPHHYSPPKVELSVVQQVENLNLNDDEYEEERQHLDSYTEPAQVQTSEDDERRESTTADEGRYTTEETEGEDERLPEPVVSLPVEMEEPEPTEPIRGRPKTARKKSGGSGLAGLFSSSRPSSRTRSGNKREPEVQETYEPEEQPEPEHEEERPFDNRRPQAKGFGGLFASKRNKTQRPRPRPLSGPPAGIRQDDDEPQTEQEPEEPAPPMPLRKQRGPSFSNLFSSRRGPSTKSTGNLADRRREPEEEQPEEEEKPSYNNSTSSLSRAKRDKGFGAMFGAPKIRMSGRKPMTRSTTFPLAPQQPQQQQQQQDDYEDEQPTPQQQRQQPLRQQPKVQESPQLSESRSEDRRPPLPLPKEQVNQYSPTPKQQDSMVYDQIEIVHEPPQPRQEELRPEPPRDPNRQVGRRSGRFRRPQDGANVSNLSANDSGSLNNSRQTSSSALPRPAADTTQSVMRDIFAETVVRKPVNVAASRSSHEESLAASGLGADFEYEKAMRGPKPDTTRSRVMNKKTSNSNVGRTESYRQAHNSGPGGPGAAGAENDRDKKLSNYNSLPRLGGSKQRRQQQQQQPRQQQQQQQQEDGDNANFDTRSLGDRPRSRNARTEDPCSVM